MLAPGRAPAAAAVLRAAPAAAPALSSSSRPASSSGSSKRRRVLPGPNKGGAVVAAAAAAAAPFPGEQPQPPQQQPLQPDAVIEPGGSGRSRAELWKAAVKAPMYSVGVVPIAVAAAAVYWKTGAFSPARTALLALGAVAVIGWLNLSNDVFDSMTGVDATKEESVVNLTGSRVRVFLAAHALLLSGGGLLFALMRSVVSGRPAGNGEPGAWESCLERRSVRCRRGAAGQPGTGVLPWGRGQREACIQGFMQPSSPTPPRLTPPGPPYRPPQADPLVGKMLYAAICMGYLYQGPPFRLSYLGLGEPLCFLAFGPLATCAFYLAQLPTAGTAASAAASLNPSILALSALVGLSTTVILFTSHFHQARRGAWQCWPSGLLPAGLLPPQALLSLAARSWRASKDSLAEGLTHHLLL